MKKVPPEWLDLAATQQRIQRAGYDPVDAGSLLEGDVASGEIRVRVYDQLCPADRIHLVKLDFDTGLLLGWTPGDIIELVSVDEGGFIASRQDYGQPWQLNATDLNRRLRDLQEREAPVTPRTNRGGRPSSWNWGNAMIDLAAHMLENKAPDSPAVFSTFLRDWFVKNSVDGGPDDKLIRTWAKNAYEAWKPRS